VCSCWFPANADTWNDPNVPHNGPDNCSAKRCSTKWTAVKQQPMYLVFYSSAYKRIVSHAYSVPTFFYRSHLHSQIHIFPASSPHMCSLFRDCLTINYFEVTSTVKVCSHVRFSTDAWRRTDWTRYVLTVSKSYLKKLRGTQQWSLYHRNENFEKMFVQCGRSDVAPKMATRSDYWHDSKTATETEKGYFVLEPHSKKYVKTVQRGFWEEVP
jgi:hypothetical protein